MDASFIPKSSAHELNPDNEACFTKSVETLHGMGSKTAALLENFGIITIKDILFALPLRYEHLSSKGGGGGKAILHGVFEQAVVVRTKYGKQMFQAAFRDERGIFYGIWLHFNQQFPASCLKHGKEYDLYGTVTRYNSALTIYHPEMLEPHEIGSVRRVYSLPGKVSQKIYQRAVDHAITEYMPYLEETLPEKLRCGYKYPGIHDALNTLHNPETLINADMIIAGNHPAFLRMVYEELFYLQLRLMLRKNKYMQSDGISFNIPKIMLEEIAPIMPFRLTDAQRSVLAEIFKDMRRPYQMNRLLQGDVGSGKTIVAFLSALVAVKNGYQSVILTPTEALAEQHFRNLNTFLAKTDIKICLLTGSTRQKEKKTLKEYVLNGDIDIVVGTHALIQDDVGFKNLGFAVIDEQHRFGVKQRKILMNKGKIAPDILLMTATPIPRTLALTFYGDLDLSEIDSMPPGRISPVTKTFREEKSADALHYVAERLKDGERAYFVYPLIEESEKSNLKSVTKNVQNIRNYFSDKKTGLLHGRMKSDEKRKMLSDFESGALDILVSTTVVEVGVDVKDATVIVIEDADRFGLAQLHQLRGRVGRNNKQSYCVLIASEGTSEIGFRRLRAMEEFTSGFKLSELDLELRGQGDFFGVKQSGMPEFRFADIIRDSAIVRDAREDARRILDADPYLDDPQNRLLRSVIMRRWKDEYELFLVG
ncbi:MAG: ATP-dependent DNA helicase RecG [Deferribacteraceae bacterium]|nr:ATP-dependent DNA helicase RecG [Deferribacteraceae bacterium]